MGDTSSTPYSHSTGSDSSTRSSGHRSSPVRDEGDDRSVRASDHKDADVPPANTVNGGEEDVADHDKDEAAENVHDSLLPAVGPPRVADDHEEGEGVGRDGEELTLV